MRFTFSGTEYEGREGETLAAALVRTGVLGGFRSLYRDRNFLGGIPHLVADGESGHFGGNVISEVLS